MTSQPAPPPAEPMTVRSLFGKLRRWIRPSALGLVLVFFAFPFLMVSCSTPGGFGHVSAGGTTTWTGYTLLTGADPARTPDTHVLPAAQAQPDTVGFQVMIAVTFALVIAAIVCSLVITERLRRRYATATLAALASVALTVGLLLVRNKVVTMVTTQLGTMALPAGETPSTYVQLGQGYWASMIALWAVVIAGVVGWFVDRRRTRPDAPGAAHTERLTGTRARNQPGRG